MATALDALTSSQPFASSAFPPRHPSSQSALSATSSAELVAPSTPASSAYWTAAARSSWPLNPNNNDHYNVYPQDAMTLNPNVSSTQALSQPYELAPFPPSLSAHHPQHPHQPQHPMGHAVMAQGNPPADSSPASSTSPPPPSLGSTDRYASQSQSIQPLLPGANNTNHPLSCPRPPWPSYSLPAMNGPVLTNINNPNSHMSLVGGVPSTILPGISSGHAASMQQMYGGPSPTHQNPGPAQDRPFKCDQCPQSFNRNHDLKRHKRIHLSVKPFPCTHCDKSFSRKDALKRHLLVKGCGKHA